MPVRPLATGRRGRGALRAAVAELRPDVVAFHDRKGLQLLPRGGLGVPAVVHRRVDFVPSRWSWHRYRRADGVVAVSEAVARVMRRVVAGGPWVEVVHDGVAPPPPVPIEGPGEGRLLAVGALVDHKGHRTLLDALVELPGATLIIAGEGPRRPRLERQVARLGLSGRVQLVGQIDDVDRLRRGADLLVHPSHEEGLGQAVLEALLAGLPVVAAAAGGLPESVGGVGWLVPPRRPTRLAKALRQALSAPSARERLAAQRPMLLHLFGVDRMVRQTLLAYQRAAARGTLGPCARSSRS